MNASNLTEVLQRFADLNIWQRNGERAPHKPLLVLLALGTFLAGVHLRSLQIGFLGLALALAVPAISWVKQSALFFILAAVFLVGLAMAFWSYWGDTHPKSKRPGAVAGIGED